MPIYEYECTSCGYLFEMTQKFSDPILKTCPKCSGNVKKLISRCSFKLNGSGWYVTDYKRNSKNETTNKESHNKCNCSVKEKTPSKDETSATA